MREEFIQKLFAAHRDAPLLPSPQMVCDWLGVTLRLLFPELAEQRYRHQRELVQEYDRLQLQLFAILEPVAADLKHGLEATEAAFWDALPTVHAQLLQDADAILLGDPAAVSKTEVIRTYPGFYALAVYRLAHEFHKLGVPLIPRVLTEHAHARTGVDIHPGARIGERFCIDHGSGVVIGETVSIGDDVKIYQGVTLGALSVKKEMALTKRHPTIEDRVVIYAGATILGGDTVVGSDSIIGGNTWLVHSVPPFSRIYYKQEQITSA